MNDSTNQNQHTGGEKLLENRSQDPSRPDLEERKSELGQESDKYLPFICVLGTPGVGKSALCNVLCESKTEKLFSENAGASFESQDKIAPIITKWKIEDKHQKVLLLDTLGVSDPKGKDQAYMKELDETIRGMGYVTQFLLVLNSAEPRFDTKFRELVDSLIVHLGDQIFQYTSVVFTHWETDSKAEAHRKRAGVTKDSKMKDIKAFFETKVAKEALQKTQLDCYFIEIYPSEDSEILVLADELIRIKKKCMNISSPRRLFPRTEELVIATSKKPAQNPSTDKLKWSSEGIYEKFITERKQITSKIDDYFDTREIRGKDKPSLYGDIHTLINKFNDEDKKKNSRLSKSRFYKALFDALQMELPNIISNNLNSILETDVNGIVERLTKIPEDILAKKKGKTTIISVITFPLRLLLGILPKIYKLLRWKREERFPEIVLVITQHIAYNQGLKSKVTEMVDSHLDQLMNEALNSK